MKLRVVLKEIVHKTSFQVISNHDFSISVSPKFQTVVVKEKEKKISVFFFYMVDFSSSLYKLTTISFFPFHVAFIAFQKILYQQNFLKSYIFFL